MLHFKEIWSWPTYVDPLDLLWVTMTHYDLNRYVFRYFSIMFLFVGNTFMGSKMLRLASTEQNKKCGDHVTSKPSGRKWVKDGSNWTNEDSIRRRMAMFLSVGNTSYSQKILHLHVIIKSLKSNAIFWPFFVQKWPFTPTHDLRWPWEHTNFVNWAHVCIRS